MDYQTTIYIVDTMITYRTIVKDRLNNNVPDLSFEEICSIEWKNDPQRFAP